MKVTKKYRTEQARAIIDRNMIGVPFNEHDTAELNDVLETKFDNFMRKVNPQFPSDPRHLCGCTFGEYEPFSWVKCISPVTDLQEVKKAMREAIAPCLTEFYESVEEPTCEHCGTTERLTVDHTPHFDGIALAFMASHCIPKIIDAPNGVGNIFESIDVEAHWIAFHASKIARYAILCRSCNASKGTGAAVRRSVAA